LFLSLHETAGACAESCNVDARIAQAPEMLVEDPKKVVSEGWWFWELWFPLADPRIQFRENDFVLHISTFSHTTVVGGGRLLALE
jgi:hypothetical protein